MRLIILLAIALIFTTASCSKKSSPGSASSYKATLSSTPSSAYNGTATATFDGILLTVNITHNIPNATTALDGVYDKTTGTAVISWFPKSSPFSAYGTLTSSQAADLMNNLIEVRLYANSPGSSIEVKGILIKQ